MTGRVIILRGDAASLPLPDSSVDLVVTSPPYYGLRSYTDGGAHYAGQIGAEVTPAEFIAALLDCTREWLRVLKPEGSLFVNLGDKYSERASPEWRGSSDGYTGRRDKRRRSNTTQFAPRKSLMLLPQRYAIGCVDDIGLILRAEIIWDKPTAMPESVTDRVKRSHEQVFHFTKQPRYFAAVDEIREPHTMRPQRRAKNRPEDFTPRQGQPGRAWKALLRDEAGVDGHPLGRLPGSVWAIPSVPLAVPGHLGVDHFAAYPPELCRRIILGWSPAGICSECGEGRRPVALREQEWTGRVNSGRAKRQLADGIGLSRGFNAAGYPHTVSRTTITGYACACPDTTAPTRPALVLDPFGGTGTTALVASAYGRTGISVDRSADYCRLARWRVRDPAERARAMQVPKPPPVIDKQGELFGEDLGAS